MSGVRASAAASYNNLRSLSSSSTLSPCSPTSPTSTNTLTTYSSHQTLSGKALPLSVKTGLLQQDTHKSALDAHEPPSLIQQIPETSNPVTSITTTSITCSSLHSDGNAHGLTAYPFDPRSIDDLTFPTSLSLTSTAVGSNSNSASPLAPTSATFSSESASNFPTKFYLEKPIEALSVNNENPAYSQDYMRSASPLNSSPHIASSSRQHSNTGNVLLNTATASSLLPPKNSELRALFYNDSTHAFNDSILSCSSYDDSITRSSSPASPTITVAKVSPAMIAADPHLLSQKVQPQQQRVSASNPASTHGQNQTSSFNNPSLSSQKTSAANSSEVGTAEISNNSISVSSKSSLASISTFNCSPRKPNANALRTHDVLSTSSLLSANMSTTSIDWTNAEGTSRAAENARNRNSSIGGDKYSSNILPNMRRKSSQQSLRKKRSHVLRKKSSRQLKPRPSMLDMIDNNKLTTFPQVYSTFVGLSDQVEHSSSPVGSSENLRDVTHYHTFSGVGKNYFQSNSIYNKSFDGEASVSSLMVANNLESGIVFVEDYFDEVHLQNKTARNFSSANFSSANFGSPTAHSKSKSSTSILGNLSGAAESSQRLARLINKKQDDSPHQLQFENTLDSPNIDLEAPFAASSPNDKGSKSLHNKSRSLVFEDFGELLATPSKPSKVSKVSKDSGSTPALNTQGSSSTVSPIKTPKRTSKRNVSSSSHTQLSPFSTMRRGSMLKVCVHCQKPLYELALTQYSEIVCNDCAGFHQLLSGGNPYKPRTTKPFELDNGSNSLNGSRANLNTIGYNSGSPIMVNKLRSSNNLNSPNSRFHHNNYTTTSARPYESAIDLTSTTFGDITTSNHGRHTIGPNTRLSASMTSLGSMISTMSLRSDRKGSVGDGKSKLEWYASVRKKLRWRWRISGLLPRGLVAASNQ